MLFGRIPFASKNKYDLIEEIGKNKLFQEGHELLKSGHLKIQGVTISEEAFCFLQDTLQVNQAKRLGWV